MEAILGMLGVDKDEIMSQVEALIKQVNEISKNTEENHVMLTFLVSELPEEKRCELQKMLSEVEKR
jgi:uncharacterized tellurite resistance protein B-like protein